MSEGQDNAVKLGSGARRSARRARGAQSGYSLIEVLIAVMLVGTVVAALAAGMLTMMNATRSTSEQQRLQAGVLSYTEWLRSQTYTDCATSYSSWTGEGVKGKVDGVRYWVRAPGAAWGDGSFATTCNAANEQGRQLIDVTVSLDGGPSTTAQVVLRKDT